MGTLGRLILDGKEDVRIQGRYFPVRARVKQISGFSAHADRDELMRWLSGFQKPPRHVFITHGEVKAANSFADFLREQKGWNLSVPTYQNEAILD